MGCKSGKKKKEEKSGLISPPSFATVVQKKSTDRVRQITHAGFKKKKEIGRVGKVFCKIYQSAVDRGSRYHSGGMRALFIALLFTYRRVHVIKFTLKLT